jgi:tRNA(Ile)-lysidine synthase
LVRVEVNVVSHFEQQVRQTLADSVDAADGMVVAVSGGPDSVALLRALLACRPAGAGPLTVAHLDHGLRGDASTADAAFVAALHARLAAPAAAAGTELAFCQHRVDMAALARAERDNTEAVARRVRYAWLTEVALAQGARWVATGHTASDQAETVLHRLLRGTGLHGLRGIAVVRTLVPGVRLVRPLLRLTRQHVLAYLSTLGQEARQDASNDDLRFTRNRLRHELLPQLARHYNPAIQVALCRLAEQAAEAVAREEAAVVALLGQAERPPAGSLRIFDAAVLARAPRDLVRALFRQVWERERWPSGRLGFDDWDRLADLAKGRIGAFDLCEGIRARRRGGMVQVGPAPRATAEPID